MWVDGSLCAAWCDSADITHFTQSSSESRSDPLTALQNQFLICFIFFLVSRLFCGWLFLSFCAILLFSPAKITFETWFGYGCVCLSLFAYNVFSVNMAQSIWWIILISKDRQVVREVFRSVLDAIEQCQNSCSYRQNGPHQISIII